MFKEKFKISNKEYEAILGLIPLMIFFITQTVHDLGTPKFGEDVESYIHTNWSIFYFSGIFVSYLSYIVIKFKQLTKSYKLIYGVLGIPLLLSIIIEISSWGTDFYIYIKSVNSLEKGMFLVGIILFGLFIVLILKKHLVR